MKKVIILALVILMAIPAAAEEIDLSKLSYEELSHLISECSIEIQRRPEWKETTIPAGVYIVGEDIPEGKWTFIMKSNATEVCTYSSLKAYKGGSFPDFDQILSSYTGVTEIGNLYLKKGEVLLVEGSVTVRPFRGLGL